MNAYCTICGKETTVDAESLPEDVGARHEDCQRSLDLRNTARPVNELAKTIIAQREGKP